MKHVEYIVAIADERNISRAAEKLNITQSALSQALLNVEKSLGIPLFNRNQKTLELTDAGICYVKGAREILHIKKRVMLEIQGMKPRNETRYYIGISSQTSFDLFFSRYHRFKELFPDISIQVTEGNASELMDDLHEEKYSLILTAADSFEKISLPHQPLKKEEILLVAPKNYSKPLLSKHGNLNMALLRHENFILAQKNTTMRRTTDRFFASLGYKPHVICETGHTYAVFRMVSQGIGFAILSESLRTEMENIQWISFYPPLYRTQMATYQEKYANDEVLMSLIRLLKE